MILLEANHLQKHVKDRLLFDIKHLIIQKNDRIGFVGHNGSGKTTLLELLAGKQQPEQGYIATSATRGLLSQLKNTNTTKSGGEVTQEYINQSLAKKPDILFADEPTTNLDTDNIEKLEQQLNRWQGAYLIVSHDRAFLDSLCTTIWEISEGTLKIYNGGFSDYTAQKELERHQQESAYEQYQKKKQQLEKAFELKEQKAQRATKKPKQVSSSEARIKGTKPYFANKQKKLRQSAKAIETRLDKLVEVEKIKEMSPIKMHLPNEETLNNRIILRLEEAEARTKDRLLWRTGHIDVRSGEKIAIIGKNGSGKTTLLKKIMNQDVGVTISPAVKIGYFSQNLDVLDVNRSILENVNNTSNQDETLIRTVLARLRFFRDDVYKKVHVLSGGERVKVAFAKLFVSDINTLLLDEPTTFLDIEAVEALEGLLKDYEGTVFVVSHDRRFISSIASRIFEIKNKVIHNFDGTYDTYKKATPKIANPEEEDLLILDTKITEVLGKLSIASSEELEQEYQRLLSLKRKSQKI